MPEKVAKEQEAAKIRKIHKTYEGVINSERLMGTHKEQWHLAVGQQTSVAKVGESDFSARSEKTSKCRKTLCCRGEQSGGL